MLHSELDIECTICSAEEAVTLISHESQILVFFEELENPTLTEMSQQKYKVLQTLFSNAQGMLWASAGGGRSRQNPAYGMIDGLSRSFRNENPKIPFVTVALEIETGRGPSVNQLRSIQRVIQNSLLGFANGRYEPEYVEIDSMLQIPRAVPALQLSQELHLRSLPQRSSMRRFSSSAFPLRVCVESPGMLDSINFTEDEVYSRPLAPDEIEMELKAISLAPQGCDAALGRVSDKTFGKECAGIVTRIGSNSVIRPGNSVFMYATEAFKSFVRGKIHHACTVPGRLSFAQAASIPLHFSTAWQILNNIARTQRADKVLIHAGAGGTGQAIVQIAMLIGAEIFVTVSSAAKKRFLINQYGIANDHIFYSRDTGFATGLMRMTNQRGADLIIGSVSGDVLAASLECVARYGRLVQISRSDIATTPPFLADAIEKNISFTSFDVYSWLEDRPAEASRVLRAISDSFAAGRLQVAQPLQVHDISDITEVLQSMQVGSVGGKFVLEVTEDALVAVRGASYTEYATC